MIVAPSGGRSGWGIIWVNCEACWAGLEHGALVWSYSIVGKGTNFFRLNKNWSYFGGTLALGAFN